MKPALHHGRGPHKAIVMNGWMGCAHHWQNMLDAVSGDEFEIAVFDYRGYGTRRDETGRYTFEEAAQDVLKLADELTWPRFDLIGHSMGGMAMQRVALAAPGRVAGLLGLAPVSAAGSRMDEKRLAVFEQAIGDVQARERIVQFSTGQRLSKTWSTGIAADSFRSHRPEAVAGYLRQWAVDGFAEQLEGLVLPVKLMVGEHDPSITVDLVERTWRAHYPQAVVEVVGNAGHYPMQEAPLAVAAAVQQWLARSPG
jgi:pimeloyl-ACP methyl ester carboxylesterase